MEPALPRTAGESEWHGLCMPSSTSTALARITRIRRFFPNKNSFRKSVSNPVETKNMGG
jgi:hypothetical protein